MALKSIKNRFAALALSAMLLFSAKCVPPKLPSESNSLPKTEFVFEKKKEFSGKLGNLLKRLHEPDLFSEPRDSVRFRETEVRDFLALKKNKLVADKKNGLLHLLDKNNDIVFSVPWVGSHYSSLNKNDRYFMGDMGTPEGIGDITGKSKGGPYYGRFQINWARRHSSVYADISRTEMARYLNEISLQEHGVPLSSKEYSQVKSGREVIDAFKKRHGFIPSSETQIGQFNAFVSQMKAGLEPYPKMGTAIYLHGGGSSKPWTWGCLAVENEHFDELFRLIPAQSKILVLPSKHKLNYDDRKGERLLGKNEINLGETKFVAKRR